MSSVSVAEAGRQLSHLINRAAYGREIVVITSRGQAKAVLLGMEAFDHLVGMDEYTNRALPPLNEFRQRSLEALSEAGYSTREKILEMTREVRRERIEDRDGVHLPASEQTGYAG